MRSMDIRIELVAQTSIVFLMVSEIRRICGSLVFYLFTFALSSDHGVSS